MKKLTLLATCFFCLCTFIIEAKAQDVPDINAIVNNTGNVQVHLQYPSEAKIGETVFIRSSTTPKNFGSRNAMSVKISSTKNPEADYSAIGAYPNARVTFYKAGTYALRISTGLLVADG